MKKSVEFTKMHGAGNDFILVSEWDGEVVPESEKPSFVAAISDRHLGVGSDGVIFVQKSSSADARFRFHNPDGSLAEMCGNGIRCFAKFVYEKSLVVKKTILAETSAGVKKLELSADGIVRKVKVSMGKPQVARGKAQVAVGDLDEPLLDEDVTIVGNTYKITAVGMGNPHAVVFVDDVEKADVIGDGRLIRNHREYFPNGVNVHFVEKTGDNEFRIRSYERGVEAETLACGTGICASGVAAVLAGKADAGKSMVFNARGGMLRVDLKAVGGEIVEVFLAGPAEVVFEGVYRYGK